MPCVIGNLMTSHAVNVEELLFCCEITTLTLTQWILWCWRLKRKPLILISGTLIALSYMVLRWHYQISSVFYCSYNFKQYTEVMSTWIPVISQALMSGNLLENSLCDLGSEVLLWPVISYGPALRVMTIIQLQTWRACIFQPSNTSKQCRSPSQRWSWQGREGTQGCPKHWQFGPPMS